MYVREGAGVLVNYYQDLYQCQSHLTRHDDNNGLFTTYMKAKSVSYRSEEIISNRYVSTFKYQDGVDCVTDYIVYNIVFFFCCSIFYSIFFNLNVCVHVHEDKLISA